MDDDVRDALERGRPLIDIRMNGCHHRERSRV